MTDPLDIRTSIGCALLADAASLEGPGYASINGSEAAPFEDVDALGRAYPGVVWVTGATEASFIRHQGHRKPWLRSAKFLATPLTDILAEIGGSQLPPEQASSVLSEILSRVLFLSRLLCPFDFPGSAQLGLHDLIRNFHFPLEARVMSSSLISNSLRQYLLNPLTRVYTPSGEDILVSLTLSRVAHMEAVMTEQVPSGAWHEINLTPEADPYRWVRDSQVPVVALISLSNPRTELSVLMTKAFARGTTLWMPHPELRLLGDYADVTVHSAFFADEYIPVAGTLVQKIPKMEPLDHVSISCGVLAESYLFAATGMAAENSQGAGHWDLSRPAWLLSAARSRVLVEAAKLTTAGFRVTSYGAGEVTVGVKKQEMARLRSFVAASESLIIPAKFAARLSGVSDGPGNN